MSPGRGFSMTKGEDSSVKERIIDAGIKLFLANGFVGTSVRELTDAAGVARGTLYWYFKSKDQILEEILDKVSKEVYDVAIERVDACEGDFMAKFKVFYKAITQLAVEKKELLLVSSTVLGEIVGTNSRAEEKIKELQMKFHGLIKRLLEHGKREGAIRGDLDADIHAHIMQANFVGMHLQWCLMGDSLETVSYARAYRGTILRGLGIKWDRPDADGVNGDV